MEPIRAIALRQESNALAERSKGRLSDGQAQALHLLLDQIAGNWPHQEFGEATAEIWREGFEELALEFTLKRLRDALQWFITRRKFFPQPAEVRERLEAVIAEEAAAAEKEQQRRQDMQQAQEFDRFLAERIEAGETEASVIARFPAMARVWQTWKLQSVPALKPTAAPLDDRKMKAAGE